jgi:hypothetical protein
LEIEVITQGLEKTAMGDALIMNLGNLEKGEKRIVEYKIINAEELKEQVRKDFLKQRLCGVMAGSNLKIYNVN